MIEDETAFTRWSEVDLGGYSSLSTADVTSARNSRSGPT